MSYLKYTYRNEKLKLIIEEDLVGCYLIVYYNTDAQKSREDYLVESLDEAFQDANEKFGVSREEWDVEN